MATGTSTTGAMTGTATVPTVAVIATTAKGEFPIVGIVCQQRPPSQQREASSNQQEEPPARTPAAMITATPAARPAVVATAMTR
jgi:hypothetical protein